MKVGILPVFAQRMIRCVDSRSCTTVPAAFGRSEGARAVRRGGPHAALDERIPGVALGAAPLPAQRLEAALLADEHDPCLLQLCHTVRIPLEQNVCSIISAADMRRGGDEPRP